MSFGNRIGAQVDVAELPSVLQAQLGGFVFTSPEQDIPDAVKIGQTKPDFTLIVNGVQLEGAELLASFEGRLEPIYPTEFKQETVIEEVPALVADTVIKSQRDSGGAAGLHSSLPWNQLRIRFSQSL